MTDYWKSTAKYLCKYCDQYIKDTKFERQLHEASDRHQRNIQRHLRQVQKAGEREEREKQRAKAEVARLNRIVGGPSASSSTTPKAPPKPPIDQQDLPWKRKGPTFKYENERETTKEDIKRRAEELAALGVQVEVPQEFRDQDTAPGAWKVVSVRNVIDDGAVVSERKEEDETAEARAVGVRPDEEEEEEPEKREAVSFSLRKTGMGDQNKRKRDRKLNMGELDALFGGMSKKPKTEVKTEIKAEDGSTVKAEVEETEEMPPPVERSGLSLSIKKRQAPATRGDLPPILMKKRNLEQAGTGRLGANTGARFLG